MAKWNLQSFPKGRSCLRNLFDFSEVKKVDAVSDRPETIVCGLNTLLKQWNYITGELSSTKVCISTS